MMKRVMSAPVGASRFSQQQPGHVSSGAAAIGTAAFHPRSPNVALDQVRRIICCRFLLARFTLASNAFGSNSSNLEGARAAAAATWPAFTAKFPARLKVLASDQGLGVGQAALGVLAENITRVRIFRLLSAELARLVQYGCLRLYDSFDLGFHGMMIGSLVAVSLLDFAVSCVYAPVQSNLHISCF
jgi:hypothetical protein